MPDHWHAILVIGASKAGKDIYCQKPLALTIVEGRTMSYAVAKHHVVFQTGSQQRSDYHFRRACELVRNGRIGDLKPFAWAFPVAVPILPSRRTGRGLSRCRKVLNTTPGLARRPPLPTPRAVPRQLPLDPRLFRRPGHRLGGPPRLCPVGHRYRVDRPDRVPQRQGRFSP